MTIAHRVRRAALVVTGGAIAALTLSGCLAVNAEVTVNADATATGTISLAVQKSAATMLGISDADAFSKALTQESADTPDVFSGADCTSSETDTDFVYTCPFTDAAFTGGEDDPWTITKDGSNIVFTLTNTGNAATGGDSASGLLGDGSLGTMTVDVTMPGPIASVSGAQADQTSDTTVTISGALTDAFEVTITSASGGSSGWLVWLIVGIGILVVLAIIAIVLLIVLKGRTPPAGPALQAAPPASDGGAPTVVGSAIPMPGPGPAAPTTSDAIPMPAGPTIPEPPAEPVPGDLPPVPAPPAPPAPGPTPPPPGSTLT